MSRALAEVAAPEFDLGLTLGCGQVFHWRRHGAGWLGMIGDVPCYAEQHGEILLVPRGMEQTAAHYFALDHPLAEMRATFPTDPAMAAASAACRGLRLVRQPHWECVATFITSAQKAVVHIAQISHVLRQRYGRAFEWEGERLFSYPNAAVLGALEETDLRACALGYRAKNLLRAARMVASGEVNFSDVARLGDSEAEEDLQRLPGVGPKVANCALLFGFGRLAAFPIDVWIERILRSIYFARKRKVTAKRLREFSARYFGPYGGYAQQYLFHHARTTEAAREKITMKLDAALTPADISRLPERDLSATTCVVFDVLRATSSMITALANGAAEIFPVKTIEEALALRNKMPDALLGGERHGERIEGFDLGNNPFEYTAVTGKRIISTTTNGTVALRACERAGRVLVGALLNLAALRDELARTTPAEVLLVCAGTFETFALEDAIAAGLLAAEFPDAELTDAAVAATATARRFATPIEGLLAARNGLALAARGWRDQIEWCAQISRFGVIGAMNDRIIRSL